MIPVPAMESAAKSFILPMKKHFNIKETVERQQEFLLPHAVFAEMYSHHHDAFESRIRGADGKMATFWSTMEGNPQFERHPVKDRQGFEQFAVPLSIHGDGVPVTGVGKSWGKSVDVISWSSLLGTGATLDCSFS
jgi:hypothetical protein